MKEISTNPADKVEKWDIEKLIPYARNARTHSDEQVGQIAASIREWGWTTPVLVDEDGGIIAGHGRTMAAKRLGMREVPVMVARGWSDAKKRAYVLADNKLAINAGWDDSMLALELKELGETGFDLDLTGFCLDEINALTPLEIEPGLTDEDAVPEAPEEPTTRLGDVWILGQHRLMCGDSTSVDAIDTLIDGQLAQAVVTDPPYGIGIDGQKESKSKNPKHNRKSHDFRGWDSERPDEGIFNYIVSLNVPSVIWGGNYFADILPATRGWIYWSKGQDGLTMSDGELAWTSESTPLRALTVNRAALKGSVHPTQKPLKVIEHSLEYIKAGKIVLDLFGGSGSTLIACEKTARQCRMMELDPKYCDVIVKRWQDYTGNQSILEENSKTFNELASNGN
jgi:DNA modification methylase